MRKTAISFLLASLILFSANASSVQAREKINLIYASISGLFLGAWVAKEAGYFDKEDLDVNMIYIQSASTAMQALLAGEAVLALAGGEPVVESGLQGADTVFIGGISVVPAVHFVVVPEIRSVTDLRGKPVGVTRYGSSTDFAMRQVLRRNGLDPVKDVTILQIVAGHRALAAALLKRAVYAATIAPPNSYRAEKGGAKILIDMAKSGIYFPYSSIISTRSYINKNQAVTSGFLRAYSEGVKRMNNDKAFSVGVIKKYMREEDPEILETTYKYALDFIVRVPYLNKEGVAEILRQSSNPKAKTASPDEFIDDRFVRELEQKGLYR